MARHTQHPETTFVSEGFDPTLSVMAVRPPIYPVSTYAFRTAEQAAHHFDVALGRAEREGGEDMGLIYARLNNPNAEMFEDALTSVGSRGSPKGSCGFRSESSIGATWVGTSPRRWTRCESRGGRVRLSEGAI